LIVVKEFLELRIRIIQRRPGFLPEKGGVVEILPLIKGPGKLKGVAGHTRIVVCEKGQSCDQNQKRWNSGYQQGSRIAIELTL
jgi:hypothetical protein